MSNYTKTTNFAAKDSLPSGNAAKIVKGTEIDTEFNNIETASATKADSNNSTLTGTTAFETLSDGSISITAFVDEDNMASDSATLLPTQQSVKAYVDSQVTAQDLDFQADTGGALSIDLDSETLTFTGGTGVDTSGSGNAVTFAIDSTVATLTGSQTLSNKTLSTPVVSGNLTTDGLIDGRDVATDGTKLDGIESGATADQTAAEIKTAYESNADTNAFTDADHSKLDGIEASADVTDTANVTAAGALMDSELTSEASVKAMNQGVATTDSPTFAGVTAPITGNVTGNLTGNVTGNVTGNLTGDVTGDVTGNVTGNLTGSVLTAAQTSITSVGTLGSLTVSGDVTVDTNSLKVDSTNNRVGILNASPDVTLDIGSATDSIHIPVGTTAQRPGSPAAGYFRYNSTLSQFEGYTDAWGAIGGGGGSNLVVDTMTGDGSDTTLTLSNDPLNENNTQVYIDGVYQNKDTYSVSGTTLTFSTAPPSGSAVEAMTIQPTAVNVPADASVTSAKLSGDLVTPGALDVTGNVTADGLTVQTTNGLNALLESTTSYQYLQFKNSAETNNFIGFVSDDFVVSPANNQKLIVTAEGNVGIGTSSPDSVLEANITTSGSGANNNTAGSSIGIGSSGTTQPILGMRWTGASHVGISGSAFSTQIVNDTVNSNAFEMYTTGASPLVLGTGAAERMRIDSSGNVGIGVSNPSDYYTNFNDLVLGNTSTHSGMTIASGTSHDGTIAFADGTSGDAEYKGFIQYNHTNNAFGIGTNGAESMRIGSDGTTGFFGAAGNTRSDITMTTGTSDSSKRWGFGGGATGNNAVFYVINESNVGVYLGHGAQGWTAHSDERIKSNITSVGTVLPSLMNMRCVKFNLISNPAVTKIGFIAQDWESAFPEVVDENEHLVLEADGTIGTEDDSDSTTPVKAMAYTETIPLLLKAIQEQQATIETLTTRLTALENN